MRAASSFALGQRPNIYSRRATSFIGARGAQRTQRDEGPLLCTSAFYPKYHLPARASSTGRAPDRAPTPGSRLTSQSNVIGPVIAVKKTLIAQSMSPAASDRRPALLNCGEEPRTRAFYYSLVECLVLKKRQNNLKRQ